MYEEFQKFEKAQHAEIIDEEEKVNEENQNKIEFDFPEMLMAKFKESSKSIGQIVRQLRRMVSLYLFGFMLILFCLSF